MSRERFIGPYKLVRKLNQGGMCQVWLAHRVFRVRNGQQVRIPYGRRTPVAIKFPRLRTVDDPRVAEGLLLEAELLMQLQCNFLPKVIDYGEHEGLAFLVMAYIPGVSLTELMQKLPDAPVGPAIALHIVRVVAAALQYLHGFMRDNVPLEIIHRDVSAKNVMVTPNGDIYLMDLGVAAASALHDSSTSTVKGTPRYMAPEQICGVKTQKSDIFGLGTILWELLEWALFRGRYDDESIKSAVVSGKYDPITREVPEFHRILCERMLVEDHGLRMSANEILELIQDGGGVQDARLQLARIIARTFSDLIGHSGGTEPDGDVVIPAEATLVFEAGRLLTSKDAGAAEPKPTLSEDGTLRRPRVPGRPAALPEPHEPLGSSAPDPTREEPSLLPTPALSSPALPRAVPVTDVIAMDDVLRPRGRAPTERVTGSDVPTPRGRGWTERAVRQPERWTPAEGPFPQVPPMATPGPVEGVLSRRVVAVTEPTRQPRKHRKRFGSSLSVGVFGVFGGVFVLSTVVSMMLWMPLVDEREASKGRKSGDAIVDEPKRERPALPLPEPDESPVVEAGQSSVVPPLPEPDDGPVAEVRQSSVASPLPEPDESPVAEAGQSSVAPPLPEPSKPREKVKATIRPGMIEWEKPIEVGGKLVARKPQVKVRGVVISLSKGSGDRRIVVTSGRGQRVLWRWHDRLPWTLAERVDLEPERDYLIWFSRRGPITIPDPNAERGERP